MYKYILRNKQTNILYKWKAIGKNKLQKWTRLEVT